jgi:IS5 family transposase
MTQISRFIEEVAPVDQRVTGDGGESAAPGGGSGLAGYALVSLHCLRIYFDTSYRMTIDLLKEMPQIIRYINTLQRPVISVKNPSEEEDFNRAT